jgi:integrase
MSNVHRNSWTRGGKLCYSKSWYTTINGREVNLGRDRRAAEAKALELLRIAQCGFDPTKADKARRRSLLELVVEFEAAQRARGLTAGHVANQVSKLRRVFEGCDIMTLADVDVGKIGAWLVQRQRAGMCSARTREQFIECIKAFGNWLERVARLVPRSPFAALSKKGIRAAENPARPRDALTEEEVSILLRYTAQSHSVLLGMDGRQRALLYELALATGLRRNEIASLTPASFFLSESVPFVIVESQHTKNRMRAELPIKKQLAEKLQQWLVGKQGGEILFPIRYKETAAMLQLDCERAGIHTQGRPGGRRIDFHSLRLTFATSLGREGVALVLTQKLLRHSTPALTANVYTRLEIQELAQAVERLHRRV